MSTYTRATAAPARHRDLGCLPRRGGVVGAAPGPAGVPPHGGRVGLAGQRDRALRGQHAGALGALAPAAARRRRPPGARRLVLADHRRLRGQQRAARARGRRRAGGADGAARGRVQAHRDRHDRGRAAARRRRDPRALPRRRLRDPRQRRDALGRVDRAGDRGGAGGRRGGDRARAAQPPHPRLRRADAVLDVSAGQPTRRAAGGHDVRCVDHRVVRLDRGRRVGRVRDELPRGPLPGRAGERVRADPVGARLRRNPGCGHGHRHQGDRGHRRDRRVVPRDAALRAAGADHRGRLRAAGGPLRGARAAACGARDDEAPARRADRLHGPRRGGARRCGSTTSATARSTTTRARTPTSPGSCGPRATTSTCRSCTARCGST